MTGFELAGKVALVTGAASGIGAATVRRFLDEGARVVAADCVAPPPPPQPTSQPSAGDPTADPARCAVVACDVTQPTEVERALATALDRFGRLDAVVHCAGVTADDLVWKLDDERWRRVLAVNLDGSFHVVRAAVPRLRAQGGGAIVLISSILGLRGGFGSSNYAASKAGVIALAKSAAAEVGAFGIRVNAIAPGLIDTPMTARLPEPVKTAARQAAALGRFGDADEVADAILFLASPRSRYITGTCLRVDGGQCMGY
ncbi:MAG: SDR family oxidoreductase [Planctomycetes bacterium]|nr:SDR family oxidoreductase [Planctomycetota bacterium]